MQNKCIFLTWDFFFFFQMLKSMKVRCFCQLFVYVLHTGRLRDSLANFGKVLAISSPCDKVSAGIRILTSV